MRLLLVFALALCRFAEAAENAPPVQEIVNGVIRAAALQQQRLGPYSVTRQYKVRNRHLKSEAVLHVLWTYQPGIGKQYQVTGEQGVSGLTRRSLIKILETEKKNSRLNEDPGEITPEHYYFELAGPGPEGYELRLKPRRKSKYLLNGLAFVLREDRAIVRVSGRTSKRLSFWVSEADVIQEYTNYQGFWMPHRTRSTAHIRFAGPAELDIESGAYQFTNR